MDFHGMKRKELQALCKKHGIPANLTNGEMANRLTVLFAFLLSGGGKVETLKRTILKLSSENRGEHESDVENRGQKKVRFSPVNEMCEFEKSAIKYMEVNALGGRRSLINGTDIVESVLGVIEKKGGKRGVKGEALQKKSGISIDDVVSNDVSDGECTVVTRRSLRNKKVEDEKIEKMEDITKVLRTSLRENKFSISTDDVIPDDNRDDGSRVVTRRSLRHKKVEDEKMGEMEDVTKFLKKSVRGRKLEKKGIGADGEAGEMREDAVPVNAYYEKALWRSKRNVKQVEDYNLLTGKNTEIEVVIIGRPRGKIAAAETNDLKAKNDVNMVAQEGIAAVNADNDKALRRSKRNVTQTEDYNLLAGRNTETEVVGIGRSRRKIAAAETNDLKAKNDVNMVSQEGVAASENVLRSKRHASRHETSIVLDNVGGETNGKQEAREQTRSPVNIRQEKSAEVDNVFNEGPVRRSLRYANKDEKVAPDLIQGNALRKKEISKELLKDTGVRKEPQKQKERAKEPSLAAESSFCEEVTFNEQSSICVQLTMLDKESPVGENTRRSRRIAAEHGPPIVMDNVARDANVKQEARKRRNSCLNVQEVKAAEVTKTFGRPVRRSLRNANRNEEAALEPTEENAPEEVCAGSIAAQQEKNTERSSEPSIKAKGTSPKKATTKENCSFYVQLTIAEKEGNSVGESMSLEPHASTTEPLIMLDNFVTDTTSDQQEATNHRGCPNNVQEEESAEVDQTLIEGPARKLHNADRNEAAAPESLKQNSPQKEKETSKKSQKKKKGSTVPQKENKRKFEGRSDRLSLETNYFPEQLATQEQPTKGQLNLFVQMTITENADRMGDQSPNEAELFVEDIIDNREKQRKSSGHGTCSKKMALEVDSMKEGKLHEGTELSLPELADLQDDNTELQLETSPSDGRAAAAVDVSMSKEKYRIEMLKGHFHFSNTEDQVACFSNKTRVSHDGAFAEPRTFEGPGASVGESSANKLIDTNHSGLNNQSGPVDEPEKILSREELSAGKQVLLLTHLIDHVSQVDGSFTKKKRESVEQDGSQTTLTEESQKGRSSGTPNSIRDVGTATITEDTCKRDSLISEGAMKEQESGAYHSAHLAEMDDDGNTEELTNIMNSGIALVQRATSSSTGRDMLDAEEVNERYRNIDKELTWDETKRNEYTLLNDQHDRSERGQESDSPDSSRISSSTIPKDGNLNAGEYSSKPADFLEMVSESILATNETMESRGTGSERENMSQIGKVESHEANPSLEGSGVKVDSGMSAENEDYRSQYYALHDKESSEVFSDKMGAGKDFYQREQSVKLLNHDVIGKDFNQRDQLVKLLHHDAVTKDSNEDGREILDLKMDHIRDGDDTVTGAELDTTVLAFEDLPANTIKDRCADIEGSISSGTKGKAEKESHERCSGGESTAIKAVERHANDPADVCSHVVASPGEELASLFATPVSLSSTKEKLHAYHRGGISCARKSVEKTESIQKEQSCLDPEAFSRDEQGEAEGYGTNDAEVEKRLSRSASSAIQLTKPNLGHEEKARPLDFHYPMGTCKHQHRSEPTHPSSIVRSSDSEYVDNLSPSYDIGHDHLSCSKLMNDTDTTVLVERETKKIQESDAYTDVSQKGKLSNEQELHEAKDVIHSAKDKFDLDSQNLADLQYSIAKDSLGLTESDVTDTTKFANELPLSIEASHGTLCYDTLTNDAETVVLVAPEAENIQGTDVHIDAITEYTTSIEQENNEVKEEIISVGRLESHSLDEPHFSSKDLLGIRESDAADSMKFPNTISPIIEKAHNSRENVSSTQKADNMDLLEKVQEVDDDDASRGHKAPFEQEGDEAKESHSTMKNIESDIQCVNPQPPLCCDFVESKESESTDIMEVAHSLSVSIETHHDSLHCESLVNNEEVMTLVESREEMVQETDESDDVDKEYKASIEHEDGEEKDQIHFSEKFTELDMQELLETQSCLHEHGQELERSFHTMSMYTDSGIANNFCASNETATGLSYNEPLTNDARMTILDLGEQRVQGTADCAADKKYTALVQHHEEKDETYPKTKMVELCSKELLVSQSFNCEDCLELQGCCVADTLKVSSDLKSPSTEDAVDTLLLEILPKGAKDQGAFLETRAEEVEDRNTSSGANNASQESEALAVREHNDVKDAKDLAETLNQSMSEAPNQCLQYISDMDLVTAEGHTSQEENEPSTDIFDKVELLNMPDLASVEHMGADAGTCEHSDLQCNAYLSPSTENSSHLLHIEMVKEKDEETVHGSSEMKKPVLEAADMMETDGKISKTTEAVDEAFGNQLISRSNTVLTRGNNTAMESEEKLGSASVRENVRTILIHGTPNKVLMTADMKENITGSKLEIVGNLTAVRPARKRTALKDLGQQ